MKQFLSPHSRRVFLFLANLVMVGLIGAIDYLLGYEFSLAIFYVLPVALVSWEVGKNAGILVSVLSGAVIIIVMEIERPPLVHPLMPVWKGGASLVFLVLIAWLLAAHKRSEETRRQLLMQLQDSAVAEERNRIAREIHDTLAQGFTGISIQLEAAKDTLTADPEDARGHIERARQVARESLAEARRSVWALRPPELDGVGLAGALREFTARVGVGGATAVEFSLEGEAYLLPMGVTLGLLRICQEAVVNALRHAQARKIQVQMVYEPVELRLSVQDDGRGFDSQAGKTGKGFGLVSMRERAERIGASLEINSVPGAGTRVVAVVRAPLQSSEGQPW
jgi:signal transduction histidine kinase